MLAVLLACALSACQPPAASPAATADLPPAPAALPVEDVAPIQAAAAEFLVPVVRYSQDLVEQVVPAPAPMPNPDANPISVKLITRWEVGSPARYAARYQRPVWPGGASGVTWGIGFDGGQATTTTIAQALRDHPQVEQLQRAAGVAGSPARDLTAQLQSAITPYPLAERVFIDYSLPRYSNDTRRAFGPGFATLPQGCQGSLDDLGYNRGTSMAGTRNSEKREIRDRCIPAQDCECVAAQLRSMKRLWPDVRGLRDRREDEARTAEGGG